MAPIPPQNGHYEDGRFVSHNYRHFLDVFDFDLAGVYGKKQLDAIEERRTRLGGLYVDRVLKLVGVKRPRSIYPPKSKDDFQKLHAHIVKMETIADPLKLSLLFYILLDCGEALARPFEDGIVDKFYLPESYQLLMRGLWYMDRGDFHVALQYLTHPSLVPTFEDDILESLLQYSDDLSLPLAYYHTVQPSLKTPKAVDSLFTAMAMSSITQAFHFARAQAQNVHKQLFESLVLEAFGDVSGLSDISDRSVELVNLPFTREEEQWFEEILTNGEGRSLKRAKDTLMMRKIAIGKYVEALKIDGTCTKTFDGLNWDSIADALEEGMGPRSQDV